jgi:hypothetical protein
VKLKLAEVELVGFAGPEEIIGGGGPLFAKARPATTPRAPSRTTRRVALFAVLDKRKGITGFLRL